MSVCRNKVCTSRHCNSGYCFLARLLTVRASDFFIRAYKYLRHLDDKDITIHNKNESVFSHGPPAPVLGDVTLFFFVNMSGHYIFNNYK